MRLEPMRYCEAGTRRIGGCPSWVPDWSSVVDQRFLAGQVSCGVSRAHTKYISPDKLRVTGVLCGTVASMGALAPLKGSDDIANIIREWEPGSLRTEDYAHGGTLFDAFATLICRNNLASRLPDYEYPTLESWKQTYVKYISDTPDATGLDQLGRADIFRCLTACAERRLMVTDQGYLGLGPPEAQPGKQ